MFPNRLASLRVGGKFTVFVLFYTLYLRAFSKYKPLGGLYFEGQFNGGLCYEFGGLVHGGACFQNFLVCFPLPRFTHVPYSLEGSRNHRGQREQWKGE